MSERNKEVVRRFGEVCLGKGELAVVAEVVDEDVVDHRPLQDQLPGRRGVIDAIRTLREAFPDLRVIADDLVAEDDRVCVRWSVSGTHLGPFSGIPPTGREFTIEGLELHRLSGGRIVEMWPHFDTALLLSQLGLLQTAD